MDAKTKSNPQLSGARAFVRALGNRLGLAGLEFEEARRDLAGFGALGLISALCLQLALAGGFVVLVAISWDTPWRVYAPAMAGAVFLAVSLGAGIALWRKVREWVPFDESGGQLVRDARAIGRMVGDSDDTNSGGES